MIMIVVMVLSVLISDVFICICRDSSRTNHNHIHLQTHEPKVTQPNNLLANKHGLDKLSSKSIDSFKNQTIIN